MREKFGENFAPNSGEVQKTKVSIAIWWVIRPEIGFVLDLSVTFLSKLPGRFLLVEGAELFIGEANLDGVMQLSMGVRVPSLTPYNLSIAIRSGDEDTTFEAKDTKKSEAKAKDRLFEDRPSRGQGPRVVNGPTSSGPNPARTRKYKSEPGPNLKTNLKPKSRPKKPES